MSFWDHPKRKHDLSTGGYARLQILEGLTEMGWGRGEGVVVQRDVMEAKMEMSPCREKS